MVSGLVTSPCDQLRIFSGEARLMRMASKSAMGFAMSKGLERYKVVLRFPRSYAAARGSPKPVSSFRFPVSSGPDSLHISGLPDGEHLPAGSLFQNLFPKLAAPSAISD